MKETKAIPDALHICPECFSDVIEGDGECSLCKSLKSDGEPCRDCDPDHHHLSQFETAILYGTGSGEPKGLFSEMAKAPIEEGISMTELYLRLALVCTLFLSLFTSITLIIRVVLWLETFLGGLLHG